MYTILFFDFKFYSLLFCKCVSITIIAADEETIKFRNVRLKQSLNNFIYSLRTFYVYDTTELDIEQQVFCFKQSNFNLKTSSFC